MGGGTYSVVSRTERAVDMGYMTNSVAENFSNTSINNAMNPHGVTLRESRDSEEHPNSVPIILGLDVTGSMGTVPHHLVQKGLPDLMDKIIKGGIADPQVLFMGIGDHECDRSPLQIGQFESSDELLDKWLTDLFLEGGGGGNYGESYHLAWFFASRYTEHDAMDKRGKKGLLFTIGDEPVLRELSKESQKAIMGDGQYSKMSAAELMEQAIKKYHVFHLHICETGSGQRQEVQEGWKQLLGDNAIMVKRKEDVAQIIADKVIEMSGKDVQTSTPKEDIADSIATPEDTEEGL